MTLTQTFVPPGAGGTAEPVVVVDRLVKSYGDRRVLDGLSFTVSRGEIFGILGSNGAGKTTAVEIAQGLRQPDGGTIRVRGLDPATEAQRVRSLVGCQLQSAALPDRIRVGEALRLFARLAGDVVDWRRLMGEWDLTRLQHSPFRALSGGERQRLFLALALVNRPDVVFLDELTQGLDPGARRATWELVARVREEGATVVLVSHYMDEVETLCDRVGVLRAGRMDTVDTPAGLVSASPTRVRFTAPPALAPTFARMAEVSAVETCGPAYVVSGQDAVAVRVAAELAAHGVYPDDFRTERASLEDVFVELTREEER
jgi:ABC-2 type transport system ATP-binding protein